MFDALLPLSNKKKRAETSKKPDSPIQPASPDPFTTDEENDEVEKAEEVTPTKLVPMMQRLSSDEERKRIRYA